MKKLLLCIGTIIALSFAPVNDTITQKERDAAAKFLQETEDAVLASVKGLSEAQLKFKPAEDKWGAEDCIKHIAATELALWQTTEGYLKQAANPEKRVDIKWTDEEVMKNIEDRTNKIKTYPQFEPQNITFKTTDEALASFKENRQKLIEFVKNTKEDLRNHVAALPFGSFDCYQMTLFISAHSNRHTKQIEEVKASDGFPKE